LLRVCLGFFWIDGFFIWGFKYFSFVEIDFEDLGSLLAKIIMGGWVGS
jgi:hypothetical protein